jgi:thermitase
MGKLLVGLLALSIQLTSAYAKDYVVKFHDRAQLRNAEKSFEGAQIVEKYFPGRLALVTIRGKSVEDEGRILAALMQRDDVEYVVENFKLRLPEDFKHQLFATPDDPQFSNQWNLSKVRATEAWDLQKGSRKIVVAVVDTGVDHRHEDLAANIWRNPNEVANGTDDDGNGLVDDVVGWDFLDNDNDPADVTSDKNPGHGTHCAGIIGAVGNNTKGISGMSQRISIMPLRFIGPQGQGDLMAAIKSIDYAISKKANVISASWGASVAESQAKPLIEAVGRADAAGIVFVAAAANDGKNNDTTPMYPANSNFPGVISVAASDPNDAKPDWSNFGKANVSLSSPGLKILSTLPDNKYGLLSGTSMATPLVAGLVGLLKSHEVKEGFETLSSVDLKSLLQATGSKVAIETACMCRIDANEAVHALNDNRLTVSPAAKTYGVGENAKVSAFGGTAPYTFASDNASVVTVTAGGELSAKALGETTLKVTDAKGQTASSLTIRVAEKQSGGGGGGMQCPFDPQMCQIVCQIQPQLPWCN